MHTLIAPDDTFAILAILLLAAALGIAGERRRWFGKISGVIVTIAATAVLATANIIPSASNPDIDVPLYDLIFIYVVPLAIPLLLFNVNLKRIVRESGRLLEAFLVGTLGISVGVVIGVWVAPLGPEAYKLAGVFSATYIGGSVNFMAVADALDFLQSPLFPAAIAIDNVFTNFFIMFLFFLPSWKAMRQFFPQAGREPEFSPEVPVTVAPEEPVDEYDTGLMERITLALSVAALICAVSIWIAPYLAAWLETEIKLDILIITVLIIAISNAFQKQMAVLEPVAFQLGFFLLFVFLAVIGAASDVKEIIASSPAILLFVAIALVVHLIVMLIGCRLLRISLEELAIASAANVGGSTVSAPMAVTFDLKKAITPAILVGVLGNVIGTFIGVGIGWMLDAGCW
jgi:uncharacterized membrane protein